MPRTLKALLPGSRCASLLLDRGACAAQQLAQDAALHRQGRISRPRRRLHRLPHRARRQDLCRRPADEDAVRHALYLEHHARSANRHRHVDVRPVLPDDAQRAFPGRRAGLSGDAVRLLHQGDARRQRRDLRLSALDPAGEAAQPPARSEISLQQPLADHRMAHAVLQGRRIQARSDQIGGLEPGRLSGRRPRPLRDVPHRDQRARRQFGIAGLRGRPDPDAELVRAVADLEQGSGPRRLDHRGDHRTICARASPAAARSTGRWRKSSTTACNISTTTIPARWRSI